MAVAEPSRKDSPKPKFRLRIRKAPFPALAVALAAVFLMGVRPYHSYDVWHHIRAGWYAAPWHHGPALTEPFSAPGRQLGLPWVQYEWLAQVLIYLSHTSLGVSLTILLKAGLYALAFWFLAQAARERGASKGATAVAVLAAGLAVSPTMQVRPGVFSMLAFGSLLWLLEGVRHGRRRRIWLTPLIFVPWANMHGAYVAGWVIIAIGVCFAGFSGWLSNRGILTPFFAWQRPKRTDEGWSGGALPDVGYGDAFRLTLVLAASVAAVCVNPYGVRILTVPFELTQSEVVRTAINEWKPATLDIWLSPESLFVPILLVSLIAGRRRLSAADLALCAAFGFLALTARRHISVAAFVTAPVVASGLTPLFARVKPAARTKHIAAAAFLVAAAAAVSRPLGLARTPIAPMGVTLRHFGLGVEEAKYPIQAAEFLVEHGPGGNLFNEYGDGNYFAWRLNNATDGDFAAFVDDPGWLVFIDGRIDVYGEEVAAMYEKVANAWHGWRETLDRFNVNTCVTHFPGAGDENAEWMTARLTDALWADQEWGLVFWDDRRAVFVRDTALGGRPVFNFRPDTFDAQQVRSEAELRAAIAEFRSRVEMGPEYASSRALTLLAQALQAAGAREDALPHLRQAQRLGPENPRNAYNLGAGLLQVNRPEEAKEWFRLAIRLGSEEPAKSWNALAYCHILAGDNETGLRYARRAVREQPGYFRGLLTLSLALERVGRVEDALNAVKQAASIAPDDPSVQLRMKQLQEANSP